MAKRKIIQIDEAKCSGCGLCVSACAEGAIQIRNGKAVLVSETYCDGLGACLGECPEGAIAMVEQEAAPFDEAAALRHAADLASHASSGCPGAAVRSFVAGEQLSKCLGATGTPASQARNSALGHWPIQLRLVSPGAPFLRDTDMLLVADCVPFAYADFHERFLRGRPVVIACPKLDDRQAALEKLTAIFASSSVRTVTVVHMEVPCCTGLMRMAETALAASGGSVPLEEVVISIRGEILSQPRQPLAGSR
jgi:Fe-S-cluster-containing hydrogenase component 2